MMSPTRLPLLPALAHSRRRASQRGFTLVEMVIVILIILILAVVLVIAIMAAMNKGKAGDTSRVMDELNKVITKYKEEKGSYPVSGFRHKRDNTIPDAYLGNMELYRALTSGNTKYFTINIDQFVKYVDKNGKVQESGDEERKVFVDGWGNPLVYFEWESLRPTGGENDIFGGGSGSRPQVPEWAERKQSWDLLSAGKDGEWGTVDDLRFGSGEAEKTAIKGAPAK